VSLARLGGGGPNGSYVLNSRTVLDDNAIDVLTGSGGMDWFFAGYKVSVTDRATGEIICSGRWFRPIPV
jgi:hypothetical protein